MSQPQTVVLNRPTVATAAAANGAMVAAARGLAAQPIIVNQAGTPTAVPRVQAPTAQQNHLRAGTPAVPAAMAGARTILINNPSVRPGAPGSQITVPLATLQSLQPGQGIPAGENNLLVKTATGQYQILKVGHSSAATSGVASAPAVAAPGLNSVSTVTNSLPTQPVPPGAVLRTQTAVAQALPQRPQVLSGVPASPAAPRPPAAAPAVGGVPGPGGMGQQMTPDTAKLKCKNFLATLLRLASEQPPAVAGNVRALIQGLIDGKVEPENFTTQLQRELNSSPQPCLVPFLKKSLPYLQHSLRTGELTIEGVKAPQGPRAIPVTMSHLGQAVRPGIRGPHVITRPARPSGLAQVVGAQIPGMLRTQQPSATQLLSTLSPRPPPGVTALASAQPTPAVAVAANQSPVATPIIVRAGKGASLTAAQARLASPAAAGSSLPPHPVPVPVPIPIPIVKKEKGGGIGAVSAASMPGAGPSAGGGGGGGGGGGFSAAGDEDINDVATMGGVNLAEESQRMQGGPADLSHSAARSCKDETFLQTGLLHDRIGKICRDRGLEEPSADVVALMSHATQARLKTLLEKLSVVAEHRMDVVRLEGDRYEVTQDVRGQLRFLSDLDRLERRRHDEAERDLLMRAAKSRTKTEDPEKERLRAKAREMQRLEEEQLRHEKANNTALAAIGGPKKRLKLDGAVAPAGMGGGLGGSGLGASSSLSSSGGAGDVFAAAGLRGGSKGAGGGAGREAMVMQKPRMKRVNMRDLMFVMEQEKDLRRSALLWKAYN